MRVHVTVDVVEMQGWHVFLLWLTPRLHHTVLFSSVLMHLACYLDLAALILSILILLQLLR
jgi:hypothetical protein